MKKSMELILDKDMVMLLEEVFNAYHDSLYDKIEIIKKAKSFAMIAGEISEAGDKYSENKRYFEIMEKSISDINTKKELAMVLKNTLIYNINRS